jgi:hypothetical protein
MTEKLARERIAAKRRKEKEAREKENKKEGAQGRKNNEEGGDGQARAARVPIEGVVGMNGDAKTVAMKDDSDDIVVIGPGQFDIADVSRVWIREEVRATSLPGSGFEVFRRVFRGLCGFRGLGFRI